MILIRIDRLLRANPRLKKTRIGRDAVNDPRLVDDIRRGREISPDVKRKLEAHLTKLEAQEAARRAPR